MSQKLALLTPPVRDGREAPVTCSQCGCRLHRTDEGWVHFGGFAGRDARGCAVECAGAVHRAAA